MSAKIFKKKEEEKWKPGQQFLEETHLVLKSHVIKKVVPKAFCGACNKDTLQLQSSMRGLDNDYSLFCTNCEVIKPGKSVSNHAAYAAHGAYAAHAAHTDPVAKLYQQNSDSLYLNGLAIAHAQDSIIQYLTEISQILKRIENKLEAQREPISYHEESKD